VRPDESRAEAGPAGMVHAGAFGLALAAGGFPLFWAKLYVSGGASAETAGSQVSVISCASLLHGLNALRALSLVFACLFASTRGAALHLVFLPSAAQWWAPGQDTSESLLVLRSPLGLEPGVFSHVAVVCSPVTVTLFINGKEVATAFAAIDRSTPQESPFVVGADAGKGVYRGNRLVGMWPWGWVDAIAGARSRNGTDPYVGARSRNGAGVDAGACAWNGAGAEPGG
jgi:hypothetical protein